MAAATTTTATVLGAGHAAAAGIDLQPISFIDTRVGGVLDGTTDNGPSGTNALAKAVGILGAQGGEISSRRVWPSSPVVPGALPSNVILRGATAQPPAHRRGRQVQHYRDRRCPAPLALASNAVPITVTASARRSNTLAGSSTCVPRQPRHRPRRGVNRPAPRTRRSRAEPQRTQRGPAPTHRAVQPSRAQVALDRRAVQP